MKSFLLTRVLAVSALVAICSCSKDDGRPFENPQNPGDFKRVKKIESSATDFVSFEYNQQKQVRFYKSSWFFEPEGRVQDYVATYSYENGRIKEGVANTDKQVFIYEDGRLTGSEFYNRHGTSYAVHEYNFNGGGQLTQIVEIIQDPMDVTHIRSRMEYDQRGNLTKRTLEQRKTGEQEYTLSSTTYYEQYDNKWNPVPGEIWGHYLPNLVINMNNPLRIRELSADGTVAYISYFNYTYGEDGYPLWREQIREVNGVRSPALRQYFKY